MITRQHIKMTFICDQNRNSMTPTANGRFCAICNHEMFDFFEKSIEDIDSERARLNGNACGLFTVNPDPDIIGPVAAPRPVKLLALFSALLVSMTTKTLSAQSENKPGTEQVNSKNNDQSDSGTAYSACSSTHHTHDSTSFKDKHKPFLTTKRKEYYWTKKLPFVIRTYKPVKAPALMMGRYL